MKFKRLFYPSLTLLLSGIACTPTQTGQRQTFQNTQNDSKFNTQDNFGIKSLPINPEEKPSVVFLAATTQQPLKVTTVRDIPQNLSVDFQGLKILPAILPQTIQKGLTQKEVNETRKSLLQAAHNWLQNIQLAILDEINKKYYYERNKAKEIFEAQKQALSGKDTKQQRKDLETNYQSIQQASKKDYQEQKKTLRTAFKDDWKNLESRIFTYLPKKKTSDFQTQAVLNSVFNSEVSAALTTAIPQMIDYTNTIIAQMSPQEQQQFYAKLDNLPGSSDVKKDNSFLFNPQDPNRSVFDDRTYRNITNNPEDTHLLAPNSYVEETGLARKVKKSKVLIDETLKYFKSLGPQDDNTYIVRFYIQDFLTSLNISIPSELHEQLKSCPTGSDPKLCQSAVEVNINPLTVRYDNQRIFTHVQLPSYFIDGDVKQLLDGTDQVIFTLKLNNREQVPYGHLMDWLLGQVDNNVVISNSMKTYLHQEIGKAMEPFKDGELILRIESPQLCSKEEVSKEQKVRTDIALTNLLTFQDATTGSDPNGPNPKLDKTGAAVIAINQDNLLFDGTYTLKLAIQDRDQKTVLELPPQKVKFIGNGLNGTINGNNNPQIQRGLKIEPIDNPDSYAESRSNISYYISRSGSNLFDVDVYPVNLQSPICLPIWSAKCVEHNRSAISFNHTLLDTGLYAIKASYSVVDSTDTPELLDPKYQAERRFAALHIDYSTFVTINDKPMYLDMQGVPGAPAMAQSTSIKKIQTFGSYVNLGDSEIPDPIPLAPVGDVTSSTAPGVRVVNDFINLYRSNPQSTFDGYFNVGALNQLKDLHANSYAAFKNVNVGAQPNLQSKFLQIGFVANLTNPYSANNDALYKGKSKVPVHIEVVEKSTGTVRARFNAPVYLGTQTIYSVYWNGKPTGLNPDEIPDQETDVPSYAPGDYIVRLSPFSNEEMKLVKARIGAEIQAQKPNVPVDVADLIFSSTSTNAQFKIDALSTGQDFSVENLSTQFLDDGTISISGSIPSLPTGFSINDLKVYDIEGLDVLKQETKLINASGNSFQIIIQNFTYNKNFFKKLDLTNLSQAVYPKLALRLTLSKNEFKTESLSFLLSNPLFFQITILEPPPPLTMPVPPPVTMGGPVSSFSLGNSSGIVAAWFQICRNDSTCWDRVKGMGFADQDGLASSSTTIQEFLNKLVAAYSLDSLNTTPAEIIKQITNAGGLFLPPKNYKWVTNIQSIFIDTKSRLDNDSPSEDKIQASIVESLTQWHLEPYVQKIYNKNYRVSHFLGWYTDDHTHQPVRVEIDNVIYEILGDPDHVKIHGIVESKTTILDKADDQLMRKPEQLKLFIAGTDTKDKEGRFINGRIKLGLNTYTLDDVADTGYSMIQYEKQLASFNIAFREYEIRDKEYQDAIRNNLPAGDKPIEPSAYHKVTNGPNFMRFLTRGPAPARLNNSSVLFRLLIDQQILPLRIPEDAGTFVSLTRQFKDKFFGSPK